MHKMIKGVAASASLLATMGLAAPLSAAVAPTESHIQVSPNPARSGDAITVSNAAGDDNTCMAPTTASFSVLTDPAEEDVWVSPAVTPDSEGNWSVTIPANTLEPGDYIVWADCTSLYSAPGASLQRDGGFTYERFSLRVLADQEPTTTTTTAGDGNNATPTLSVPPSTLASDNARLTAPRFAG